MNNDFFTLPWHDAEIKLIVIDRQTPGENDSVRFCLRWPDQTESDVVFYGCYAFSGQMSFGIIAAETILEVRLATHGAELEVIKGRWRALGVELPDLKCYEIETNSTASILKVFANRFAIEDRSFNS